MTAEQDRTLDMEEMWAGETEPTVKGEAAAAICGHSSVMVSNAEELDEFHGFVQIQLERACAEAFNAGVAAVISSLRNPNRALVFAVAHPVGSIDGTHPINFAKPATGSQPTRRG